MNNKLVRYLTLIFVLIFILAGCGKVANNKAAEPANSTITSEKNGQPQSSTETSKEVDNIKVEDKENSQKEDKDDKIDENKTAANISNGINSSTKNNNDKSSDNKNTEVKNVDNKNTNSSVVNKSKKVIVIDPGHGGKNGTEMEKVSPDSNVMKPKNVSGATGIKTRTPEHVIALAVSMKLKELLEKEGYTVIMTRTTASQTISNIERAEIGNKNKADLVIRVHADSSTSSSSEGASMLIPGEVGYAKDIYKVSKQYGETIFQTLLNDVKMKSRGIVVRKDLTGFNWSKVPVVLIEMGFLSNIEEDKLLSSSDYQNKIAESLGKGIKKALGD